MGFIEKTLESIILGKTMKLSVYCPDGYESTDLPVLYFLHVLPVSIRDKRLRNIDFYGNSSFDFVRYFGIRYHHLPEIRKSQASFR